MSKIVERTLDFFEAFAHEKRPLSLTDLSRALDIPASSCHDVIHTLEERGYVYETAPRAGFYPTQKLFDLARVIAAHDSIVLRARPLLESVGAELGETLMLSKATGTRVVYLVVVEPDDPVRYSVTAGMEIQSVHATSIGKALLATLPDERWNEALGTGPLPRFTPQTIVSRKRLREDIEIGRARGFFVNDRESRPGVASVSVPLWSNQAVHIVTVAGPSERILPKTATAAKAARAAAARLGTPID